jgi:membrane protein required for colicin V production
MSPGFIDLALVSILAGFTMKGFFTGFFRSVVSIAAVVLAWLAATLMPLLSAPVVQMWMPPTDMAFPFAARALTWVTVFFGIQLVGYFLGMLIKKTGLGGADRFAGLALGAATGVVIGCLPLAGVYAMPQLYHWAPTQHLLKQSVMLKAYAPVVQIFIQPPGASKTPPAPKKSIRR